VIDALIACKLYGAPATRTAKNGNAVRTVKVRGTTVTSEGST